MKIEMHLKKNENVFQRKNKNKINTKKCTVK